MTPARTYLRHYWFQILVATVCLIKGAATRDPLFGIIPAAPLWPYVLWITGIIVIASTFAPFARRLQALAGASLVAVATLRVTSYLAVLATGLVPASAVPLVWYLIGGWIITAAVGGAWDHLAEQSGLAEAVEQGRTGG